MISLKPLLTMLLLGAVCAGSATASDATTEIQAWSPKTLSKALHEMPKGDIARGKALHDDMMCSSCHGAKGIAPTANWPNVAGQKADYSYKTLLDYRSGLRNEDRRARLMGTLAEIMSEQEMADVAVYYASLDLPASETKLEAKSAAAEVLVRSGDKSRLITPCASCHGRLGQGGINAAPALSGQSTTAFIRTMQMYKTGKRHNDVNASMAQFAKKLSDEEIRLLAEYYSAD